MSTGLGNLERIVFDALSELAVVRERGALERTLDETYRRLVEGVGLVGACVAWSSERRATRGLLRHRFVATPSRGLLELTSDEPICPDELASLLEGEERVVRGPSRALAFEGASDPVSVVRLLYPICLDGEVRGCFGVELPDDSDGAPLLHMGFRMLARGVAAAIARIELAARCAEAEDRLRSLIQGTTDSLWCYESVEGIPIDTPLETQLERIRDMVLVEANLAYARRRGVPGPEEMLGKRMREIAITPEAGIRIVYTMLRDNGFERVAKEVELPTPAGRRNLVIESFAVVRDLRLHRLWGSIRDVTEERRTEEAKATLERQLQHAQKLESIGLLAGGIAHDFNNLLTVIGSATTFAENDLEKDPARARESLALVARAARRAGELTRRLLAFSRQEPTRRTLLRPNDLVSDVSLLLRRLVREAVELDVELGTEAGLVRADPAQLEQVLVNLTVNAADAIVGVGRIAVRTTVQTVDGAKAAAIPGARPGRYVRISVSDTGLGIPDEVRERIFEPFFTTKPTGSGTGLGLSVVYGIVEQHGGFLEVESAPERGSTFHVHLPQAEGEPEAREEPAGLVAPPRGSERLLLVEDDELVRDVACQILETAGHPILVASDGEEAVRLFEAEADAIDLVVLDSVLPVLNGREVYEKLVARRPDVKVLFASGYTGGALPDEFLTSRQVRLLPKPYGAADLLRAVREVLDD
ncbi:MAG: ATP-binding protein [Polyangiales bacterium]